MRSSHLETRSGLYTEGVTVPFQEIGYNQALSQPVLCGLCNIKPDDFNLSCSHSFCKSCIAKDEDPHLKRSIAEHTCPFALVYGCQGCLAPDIVPVDDEPTEDNRCGICFGYLWSVRTNSPSRVNPADADSALQSLLLTGCCKKHFHVKCYDVYRANKRHIWDTTGFARHNEYVEWLNWDPSPCCVSAALPRLNPVHDANDGRLLQPIWGPPRSPHSVIVRDAVRIRFKDVPGDVIDLTDENPNVRGQRYRKDVKDLCTNFGALRRWESMNNILHDYGMVIYDYGRELGGTYDAERRQLLPRDSSPVRDWCKVWLEELVRFYHIQFVDILLSKRPVLQCGHFRQRPLACYTKYAKEFTTKLEFLGLTNAFLKTLFLEGFPDASASFREYLWPFVDNHDMTLMQMIAIGNDELAHNSGAHVSILHTRRRIH